MATYRLPQYNSCNVISNDVQKFSDTSGVNKQHSRTIIYGKSLRESNFIANTLNFKYPRRKNLKKLNRFC